MPDKQQRKLLKSEIDTLKFFIAAIIWNQKLLTSWPEVRPCWEWRQSVCNIYFY